MSDLNSNKIFASVLCAAVTIMLTGFVADQLFVPKALDKNAVEIEGASADSHGSMPAKPKLPDPIMALLADADIAKGAKLSKACAACHSFEKDGPVKQGPSLWNVIGSSKAHAAGFAYSDAMKEKGGNWDYDSLNQFLTKPKKFIPGTKMNFAGIKKAKDRAAFIAWLRTQADSPAALPTAEEITTEELAFAPPAEEDSVEVEPESAPAEDAAHH